MKDGGQTAFLSREEWVSDPGEESWRRRHCSKGPSGEAIPCQPKPLQRRHWARATLDPGTMALPGLARPASMKGRLFGPVAHRRSAFSTDTREDTLSVFETRAIKLARWWLDVAAFRSQARSSRCLVHNPQTLTGRQNGAAPASSRHDGPCLTRPAPAGRGFACDVATGWCGAIVSTMQRQSRPHR